MAWFEQYGYRMSPFTLKTVHDGEFLEGYVEEMQRAISLVNQGKLFVIEGAYGNGKTTFIRTLCAHVGGARKAIYFSANRLMGPLNINKLLQERFGALGRLFKITSKNMVCVIDEAHHLSKNDIKDLYAYYTKGYFKSVIFVTSAKDRIDFPKKIQDIAFEHIISLPGMSLETALAVVRKRIGTSLPQFSDGVVKELYVLSGGKSRTFLLLCDAVCRYIVDNKKKKFSPRDVKKALSTYDVRL